jgi:hypothetical protein
MVARMVTPLLIGILVLLLQAPNQKAKQTPLERLQGKIDVVYRKRKDHRILSAL